MFSKEESRANNRAVLVSRLFANHPAYPRLTTVFQTSRNNPLSAPLVHFSMKNRNKRRRNTQVAVEIFRIQNFFFPIFFELPVEINPSFSHYLWRNSLKNNVSNPSSLSLYCPNISTTFLDSKSKKWGKEYDAIDVKISRRRSKGESERSRKRKSSGNHSSALFSSNIGLAAPLGLEKDAPRWIIEKRIFRLKEARIETRFFPPLPSFSFHKSNHINIRPSLPAMDVHFPRFASIFQRYYHPWLKLKPRN